MQSVAMENVCVVYLHIKLCTELMNAVDFIILEIVNDKHVNCGATFGHIECMAMQMHDANIKSIIQVESVYVGTHPARVVDAQHKKITSTEVCFRVNFQMCDDHRKRELNEYALTNATIKMVAKNQLRL